MAAKRLKLKFSRVLPSLQLCRSKLPSTFPETTCLAALYRLSPENSKLIDIGHPKLPDPPPSTQERHGKSGSRTSDHSGRRVAKSHAPKNPTKTPHGSSSRESGGKQVNNKVNGSGWIRGEGETAALFSTSTSFSDDSSFEFAHVEIRSSAIGRRSGSTKCRGRLNVVGPKKNAARSPVRSSAVRRMIAVEGKVRGSVAVVKKSEDPYGDFRRSMVEMIVEKEMFEVEDLEQLLQCYLSLNSRGYHRVIVEAFTEVWVDLFS